MELGNISNVDSVSDIYYIDWEQQTIIFVEPFDEVARLVKTEFERGLELLQDTLDKVFELPDGIISTLAHPISILILGLEIGSLTISRANPVDFEFNSGDKVTVQYSLISFLD